MKKYEEKNDSLSQEDLEYAVEKKFKEAFKGMLEEVLGIRDEEIKRIVKAEKKIRESTPELVEYICSISSLSEVFGCTITVNDTKEWKYLGVTNDNFSFVIDKNGKSEKYVIRKLRYWVYE